MSPDPDPEREPGLRAVHRPAEAPEATPAAKATASPGATSARSPGAARTAAGREGREAGAKKGRLWLGVLLVLAAAVLLLGYVSERHRAAEQQQRADRLETELQAAKSSLAAEERRMGVVRGHVDDLATRIRLLQEIVAPDAAELPQSPPAPAGAQDEAAPAPAPSR